jgi:hypothetical protein
MVILDVSIVNVALPSIQTGLHTSPLPRSRYAKVVPFAASTRRFLGVM